MRDHDPRLCDYVLLEFVADLGQVSASRVEAPGELDGFDDELLGIPEALDCEPDTGPLGFTVVGPLMTPRPPARKR